MSADDDKALTWDGMDDPSHTPTVTKPAKPAKTTPVDVTPTPAKPATDAKPTAPGSVLLVVYGILGGAYLLYTVGWLVVVFNDKRVPFAGALTEIMYQSGEYLAIASPALWFVTAFVLTRGRSVAIRLALLVFGLVVVIPWPFVLFGA